MKILQINNFHYIQGGSDKVYFDLIHLLRKKGHEVIEFSSLNPKNVPSDYEEYFVPEISFEENQSLASKYRAAKQYIRNTAAEEKLQKLIKDHRPDVAHLHIFQSRMSSSILPVLKRNNIPVVMHLHEYKMLCSIFTLMDKHTNVCEKCAGGNFANAFIKKCNRNSYLYSALSAYESYYTNKNYNWISLVDQFIMVSDFSRNKHIQYYPEIEEKSTRVYNAIKAGMVKPQQSHQNYFVYVGRLSNEKGVLTMLKAFKNFQNQKLKIIGTGSEEEMHKKFVAQNDLTNVEFLGFVNPEEVLSIVSQAKFLIIPSEWYETFGLTIIEAFSVGTPVIGASIGAIPELIDSSRGFLFEPKNISELEDKITKATAIKDKEYVTMSNNCSEFVSTNLNEELFYNEVEKIYQQLLVPEV